MEKQKMMEIMQKITAAEQARDAALRDLQAEKESKKRLVDEVEKTFLAMQEYDAIKAELEELKNKPPTVIESFDPKAYVKKSTYAKVVAENKKLREAMRSFGELASVDPDDDAYENALAFIRMAAQGFVE